LLAFYFLLLQHFKKELNNLERVKNDNEYMRKNSEQVCYLHSSCHNSYILRTKVMQFFNVSFENLTVPQRKFHLLTIFFILISSVVGEVLTQ